MNRLIDNVGETIPGLVAYVTDEKTGVVIETKMLDGSFTTQIIGEPSTSYVVEFYCSTATRKSIEDMLFNGDMIVIEWRGLTVYGFISGSKIEHEKFWPKNPNRQEKLKITIVETEV